ncbi:MAG: ribonuclease Z [Candidatus Verstraetearchaeota archaeon]|nr:ribonuclease Z [Candidatus Verstraetearchaeota archaeon]
MVDVRITFLGTSAGMPTRERGLPSVLIEADGELVLFDCGEGTQRQLMKVNASLGKRMKIFVSHMHGDHIFGLPGLIQTMNLINRTHPLEVFGPPGLKEFIEQTTVPAMCKPSFDLEIHEVEGGEVYKCRQYTVFGSWTEHSVPNLAYKITFGEGRGRFLPERAKALGIPEGPLWGILKAGSPVVLEGGRVVNPYEVLGEPVKGISVVYSGDTRPCESVKRLAAGAEILIHEATFSRELEGKAEAEGHSTAHGAASVAKEANVGTLILTHFSARYHDLAQLEIEAKEIFSGARVAKDLESYDLKA